KALMERGDLDMQFSVSATNRKPRAGEKHGESYYFMTDEEFMKAVGDGLFLEHEEVYPGRYYGTLKSEVERITSSGHNMVLDIDVNGGINVKRLLGDRALSVFIMPPGIDALRVRLEGRGTDSAEVIAQRLERASYELDQAPHYDVTVVNDDLAEAVANAHDVIAGFISE
ncbi:MAG: guanylate kinase, partial [Muribaculaceae bacterium]|nr:guanylate kinase [Muribaculaceae bacterium]